MATNRHPIRHSHRGRLNHPQEMVLRYGEDPRWDAFHSEEEHRDAWLRNRDRFLAQYRYGRRPQAWWQFEAPIPYPGYDCEQSTLYDAGLLGDEERAQLVSEWRQEFEKAQVRGFTYCAGFAKPGATVATWLKGAAARRAHYRWAAIPRELLKEWMSQRRRRSKTIRKLETASPAETTAPEPAAQ
jgi:hypothetical protein